MKATILALFGQNEVLAVERSDGCSILSLFPFRFSLSYRAGKATFRALLLVSRKFCSLWTDISIQNVVLWTSQIPSFLQYLLKYPHLAPKVRSLTFIGTEDIEAEEMDEKDIANELLWGNRPRFKHARMNSREVVALSPKMLSKWALGEARSIIVDQCTNLRELNFQWGMFFPVQIIGLSSFYLLGQVDQHQNGGLCSGNWRYKNLDR